MKKQNDDFDRLLSGIFSRSIPSDNLFAEPARFLRQAYIGFCDAGFDEDQSLYLTGEVFRTMIERSN